MPLDGGFLQPIPVVFPGLVVSCVILGLSHGCSKGLKQVHLVMDISILLQYNSDNDKISVLFLREIGGLELDHLSLALPFSSQLEMLGSLDGTLKQDV